MEDDQQAEISYQTQINKVYDFNTAESKFSTKIDAELKFDSNQSLNKDELEFFDQMRETLDNEDVFGVIMKLFSLYVNCIMGADELFSMIEGVMNEYEPSLFEIFKCITLSREVRRRAESWFCKNIKDQPVGKLIETIDKSYSILPKEFLIPSASGRDSISKEVLNDYLVSIPIGTEHRKPKNHFEDDLYKIEDNRYYYDQLISCNQSVINILEESNSEIEKLNAVQKADYTLGPLFTDFKVKWIF